MKSFLVVLISLCVLGNAVAAAQLPHLLNAQPVERSARAGLQPVLNELSTSTGKAVWVGYSVPAIPGEHHMCCFSNGYRSHQDDSCCGSCRLDGHAGSLTTNKQENCQSTLSNTFYVFLQFDKGQVEHARMFSPNCTIDAQGVTLFWLSDVLSSQSVEYLTSLVAGRAGSDRGHDVADEILAAIALHADPSADKALENFVQPGQPTKVRNQAAFWIGNTRGARGLDVLLPLIKADQDHDFLEQAIFAISQNSEKDRAFRELVQFARQDPRFNVREEALFWLAQEAGRKAAGVITESIENDPETDVKKKAVFALSELPSSEGVPLLIDQARKNPNPVVRKEAVFWLGQSDDQRAVEFIASILEK